MNRPTSISEKRYREEKQLLAGYIGRAEDILRQPRKLILPVPSYGKTSADEMPMLLAFERRQRINIAANWLFHVLTLGMVPHLTLSRLDTRHQRYALEKRAIARRRCDLGQRLAAQQRRGNNGSCQDNQNHCCHPI